MCYDFSLNTFAILALNCRQAAIYISQLTYFFLSCDCSKWLPAWERREASIQSTSPCCYFCSQCLSLSSSVSPFFPFQFPAMSSGCKLQQWQASNRLCCYYFRQLSLPDAQYSLSLSLCRSLPPLYLFHLLWLLALPWLTAVGACLQVESSQRTKRISMLILWFSFSWGSACDY